GSREAIEGPVLDADGVRIIDESRGELVEEVPALVCDPFVQAGDLLPSFTPVPAPFGLPREGSVASREASLGAAQVRGRRDRRAVAKRDGTSWQRGDTDDLAGLDLWQRRVGHEELDVQGHVPLAGGCASEGGALDSAVHLAGLADTHPPDL